MITRKTYTISWTKVNKEGVVEQHYGVYGLNLSDAVIAVQEAKKIQPKRNYFYYLERTT